MTELRLWVLTTEGAVSPWNRALDHQSGCRRAKAMTSFMSDTATYGPFQTDRGMGFAALEVCWVDC